METSDLVQDGASDESNVVLPRLPVEAAFPEAHKASNQRTLSCRGKLVENVSIMACQKMLDFF